MPNAQSRFVTFFFDVCTVVVRTAHASWLGPFKCREAVCLDVMPDLCAMPIRPMRNACGSGGRQRRSQCSMLEDPELSGFSGGPYLVACERRRCDHSNPVVWGGDLREVDAEIVVGQGCMPERGFADEIMQLRCASRKKVCTVPEKKIKRSLASETSAKFGDGFPEFAAGPWIGREASIQVVKQRAESILAVGLADRVERTQFVPSNIFHRPVVSKDEVPSPQLADERMSVLEGDASTRFFSDMRNGKQCLYRIFSHVLRKRGMRGGGRLEERSCCVPLVKSKSPSVRMWPLQPSPKGETRKRKNDIGRDVALHPEELAHLPAASRYTTSRFATGNIRRTRNKHAAPGRQLQSGAGRNPGGGRPLEERVPSASRITHQRSTG